jgi:hypothetical protein
MAPAVGTWSVDSIQTTAIARRKRPTDPASLRTNRGILGWVFFTG